jgi:vacuolar-type H+-ATPase catalytic subunit A/Vma1
MRVLQQEAELEEIVRLVGIEALSKTRKTHHGNCKVNP